MPRYDSAGFIERIATYDWPAVDDRSDAVEITFVAGVSAAADVPHDLRHAIKILATHYEQHPTLVNVGNIVTQIPLLDTLIGFYRVGGYVA